MLADQWKDVVAIGMSATPWAQGMGLHWNHLVVGGTTRELVEEGYLTNMTVWVPPNAQIDRSKLHVRQGEFIEAESSLEACKITGDVVDTWVQHGSVGKTLLFCVNRVHARDQQAAFAETGIRFEYIDAFTPAEERQRIFEQMRTGEIAGIASIGTLVEGLDEDVRCIIDAQPTKSVARHVQKLGRGIRTAEGKKRCVVLDHAGNVLTHGLPTEIHLAELDSRKPGEKRASVEDEHKAPVNRVCVKCGVIVAPGLIECPECGALMPRKRSAVRVSEGSLVAYGSDPGDSGREDRLMWYRSQRAIASRLQGQGRIKDPLGWSAYRFKEKFGAWPVWSWRNMTPLPEPLHAVVEWNRNHWRQRMERGF
jgi:superfamily II DNA or RNA helicase